MMGHSFCDAFRVYMNSENDSEKDLVRYADLMAKFPNGIPRKPRLVAIHSCNSAKLYGNGAPDANNQRQYTTNTLAAFFRDNTDIYMGWSNTAHGRHIMLFDGYFWESMDMGDTVEMAWCLADRRSWDEIAVLYDTYGWGESRVKRCYRYSIDKNMTLTERDVL